MLLYLSVAGVILFTVFALPTLYQYQIKEYFWPRILVSLKEGDTRDGFFIPFKMPAKSLRNLMIVAITFVLLAAYYLLISLIYTEDHLLYQFLWIGGFVVSKFVMFVAVMFTEWLAYIKRERLIKKARIKAHSSTADFIGITGSYGKSSVKEYLAEVLSSEFIVGKTEKNKNAEVGLALSVLKDMNNETQYFVAEMAAYLKGTIAKSSSIVNPKYGIITGLGNQHLALFGSKENLISAKSELFRALPEDGIAYINMDCEGWEKAVERLKCKVVTYSLNNNEASIYVKTKMKKKDGSQVKAIYGGQVIDFRCRLSGDHSILNLLPVVAMSLDLGIKPDVVSDAIGKIKPIAKKKVKKVGINGVTFIDDSYNSNVEGFIQGIKVLSKLPGERKIIISKGIIELGSEKKSSYERILKTEAGSVEIWSTDKLFKRLDSNIARYLKSEDKILSELKKLSKDDVVLVEGRFSPKFINSLKMEDE